MGSSIGVYVTSPRERHRRSAFENWGQPATTIGVAEPLSYSIVKEPARPSDACRVFLVILPKRTRSPRLLLHSCSVSGRVILGQPSILAMPTRCETCVLRGEQLFSVFALNLISVFERAAKCIRIVVLGCVQFDRSFE